MNTDKYLGDQLATSAGGNPPSESSMPTIGPIEEMSVKIDLNMTSDRDAQAESGRVIPSGTHVEYIAHLGYGQVRVRLDDGAIEIINPNVFSQLR